MSFSKSTENVPFSVPSAASAGHAAKLDRRKRKTALGFTWVTLLAGTPTQSPGTGSPMANFRTLDDLDVKGKRVLVRADLNVPVKDGVVTDTLRIDRQAPTIRELAEKGARVIVLSHFDRPKGKVVPSMSLRPVAEPLGKAVGRPVACAGTMGWASGRGPRSQSGRRAIFSCPKTRVSMPARKKTIRHSRNRS